MPWGCSDTNIAMVRRTIWYTALDAGRAWALAIQLRAAAVVTPLARAAAILTAVANVACIASQVVGWLGRCTKVD